MRLAVFTNMYPARVTTFFERDIRSLVAAGIEVHIFAIHPLDAGQWRYTLDLLGPDVLPRDRVHHLNQSAALRQLRPWPIANARRFLADAVRILASAARFGPVPVAKTAYLLPKAWTWARQFRDRFDHVLAYWGNYAATCAYLFHRLSNSTTPFSMWLHAGTDLYFRPVFLRQKARYADRIITCCDFNRAYLGRAFPELAVELARKLHVCYHGLDLAAFPFTPEGRLGNRLIAVGRLAHDKGFDDLVRAVHLLTQRGVVTQLELVGDGPEERPLRALVAELGLASQVRFRGWLPFREVQAAMRDATILVHPSTGLGDGLPNVIREAMALGTPVIASRVAGIPEALDDGRCGVLVPPRNVAALAEAIDALRWDQQRRGELAERARRHTEDKFDMWRNGARLAEVLRTTPSRASTLHSAPPATHPVWST
ncbi:MAG TPA: glycosyltransferase [Gemmatimonadales bacterium]